jgi:hypothetical protein
MSTLTGRFYYKLTETKNLIGEFSNDHATCNRVYTESADLVLSDEKNNTPDQAPFVGIYYTTWHEYLNGGHMPRLSKLQISKKHTDIFTLKWWWVDSNGNITGRPCFEGEGMLCDGILIGNYSD